MSDEGFKNGFAALVSGGRRLTKENLDLGVRIWKLEEDLHACRAHTEYLEQRIERLRAVARQASVMAAQQWAPRARQGSPRFFELLHNIETALSGLQASDMDDAALDEWRCPDCGEPAGKCLCWVEASWAASEEDGD